MLSSNYLVILYLVPAIGFVVWYLRRHRRIENDSQQVLQSSVQDGLLDPATLHPDIDPTICIGCGACVAACPERENGPVLGLINKKARLIGPSHCIGHGACHASCPVDAITLVFGTATRGVDIPFVKPNFETNVPGVYIAGELGGMGLIRNAVEQGRQAMDSIAALARTGHQNDFDVVVVGAGPAGFSASLRAIQKRLRVVTIEQDSLGGAISHFPRQKIVMTQPAYLPIVGKMSFRDVGKEKLIDFWGDVERQTGLSVNYCERVEAVKNRGRGAGFIVSTNKRSYSARAVLLAIGRRGTPRQLGVPGEDLPKVAYRLIEPEQYRGQHVLVVGGGDSALEAAIALSNEPDTKVILSYRSGAFSRARKRNRDTVLALANTGELTVIYRSAVQSIQTGSVNLQTGISVREYPNDSVIIAAGGVLPSSLLHAIGIEVETKWGTA
jgi:thioredoxin reductase/Pyruvate/2-oxoacid:ferredoxin oxidoreductase delta subunit